MTICKMSNFKIFAFITILHVVSCKAIMSIREGGEAKLVFSYPCNSTRVTLQHGNREPFYSSANPELMFMPTYQVLVFKNESDFCSIQLMINPVRRDDEGTYILFSYKDGIILPDYPRIWLGVDYPPGKASCEKGDYHIDEEWISLQCTAPLGTLPGRIHCYQQGVRLPNSNDLIITPTNLKQIILARHDSLVYCCSSIATNVKAECNCTDWGWDPINDAVSPIADPCPEVASTKHPKQLVEVSLDSMSNSSDRAPSMTKCPACNTSTWNSIFYVFTSVCLIVTCATGIYFWRKGVLRTRITNNSNSKFMRKVMKLVKERSSPTPRRSPQSENTDQTLQSENTDQFLQSHNTDEFEE